MRFDNENDAQGNIPSISRMAKPKKGIPLRRIAELGIVTAAITVVYLFTAPIIDNLIPYVGCVVRSIMVAVFLSGTRHYLGSELLLMTLMSSLLYFFMVPCLNSAIGIPATIMFMLVYMPLRRYLQAWLVVSIASIFAYGGMIVTIMLWYPEGFGPKMIVAISWSWILVLVVPLLAWWRQARSKQIGCAGCNMSCESELFKE
jgi:hypothetical protein